ncbi:MAG: HAD-IA family hydrolase [bacterium]|nr:HAD-IA family hydrolase [bacterium]
MLNTIIFDFSRVLLFPKDPTFTGRLNDLYREKVNDLGFNFFDHFQLNQELLDYLETIRDMELYVFTSDTIQEDPSLTPHLQIFRKIYSSKKLNTQKTNPEAYKIVLEDMKKSSEEVLFIDDTQANIDGAKEAGLQTILYTSNEQLISKLKQT